MPNRPAHSALPCFHPCLWYSFAQRLLGYPDVFQSSSNGNSPGSGHDSSGNANAVAVNPALATQQQRTAAIAGVLEQLRSEGLIDGWRNELYPAVQAFHDEPAFLIERAAAPHFGIKAYGKAQWRRC